MSAVESRNAAAILSCTCSLRCKNPSASPWSNETMLELALLCSDLALQEKLSPSQSCAGLMAVPHRGAETRAGCEEHTEQTFPMQILGFCILPCAGSWFLFHQVQCKGFRLKRDKGKDRLGSHTFLQEKTEIQFHPVAKGAGIPMTLCDRNISIIWT